MPGPSGGSSSGIGTGTVPPSVLYVASTQQLRTDTLSPRDREPCLVVDVNGLGLTTGYYLGRLAGSYNSLPVYEVSALPNASSSLVTHGSILNQVTNNYGPYITTVITGPSVKYSISVGTTFVIDGGGVWEFDVPVCFEHYILWDVFRDTLHTTPVADYVGSTEPWWQLDFDGSDPAWYLSGIVAPPETCEGAELVITNTAAVPMVILHDVGTVANRIGTPDGLPFVVQANESVWLRYDGVEPGWRVLYRLPPIMVGATLVTAGWPGLVPQPVAGDQGKFLRGDATWATTLTSPLTTKGDVWIYSTQDARLPVGASSKSLVADSSVPAGLNWAGGFSGSMVLPTSVTCVANVLTVVTKVFYWVEGRLQSIT